ncbi:MAG: hypothetical protein ACPHUF_16465 [Gammaproteobacteria bacterium]
MSDERSERGGGFAWLNGNFPVTNVRSDQGGLLEMHTVMTF